MTSFRFSNDPSVRHRVDVHADGVQIDATRLTVQTLGAGAYLTPIDGREQRLHAVADGDTVYVQLRGRAWRLDRVDEARAGAAGAAAAASAAAGAGFGGAVLAPMPGVVVSLHAQPGQRVAQGDPLLVIESMKLQMTIGATADGTVIELPVAVGQNFPRGAVLARTDANGGVA